MNQHIPVAIAIVALMAASALPQRSPAAQPADSVVAERSAYLMGTRVRLVAWDETHGEAVARMEGALAALESTDAELSTWRSDSAISDLNRFPMHAPWPAPRGVCEMMTTLSTWQAESDGAFDPAIGRLIDAWDIHGEGRIPSSADLTRARASSGFRRLEFDAARCSITRRADVTIDVGAFGKGEALDRAARVLGDGPWMVDFGGQVTVHSEPPGLDGWPITVAHPWDRERPYLDVLMRGGSLSTSAGSERDLLVDGRRVSHHLDPRTGQPAAFRGSVTVWHPRGLVADILSTALYVMGPEKGLPWAERRHLSACYLVPDGSGEITVLTTTAFRESVIFSRAT